MSDEFKELMKVYKRYIMLMDKDEKSIEAESVTDEMDYYWEALISEEQETFNKLSKEDVMKWSEDGTLP